MKTRQGYSYYMEDGKYTIDSYDFFDTLEDLENDLDWQILWTCGEAYKLPDGTWRREESIGKAKLLNLLDDLFGKVLTAAEFTFRSKVLEEQEYYLIADRYLTRNEITEIVREWAATPALA